MLQSVYDIHLGEKGLHSSTCAPQKSTLNKLVAMKINFWLLFIPEVVLLAMTLNVSFATVKVSLYSAGSAVVPSLLFNYIL